MKTNRGKRATDIHDETWGVNPFEGDAAWICALVKSTGKTRSEVLREMLHECVVTRQMRERGRADADERYRQLQREAVHAEVESLRRELVQTNAILLTLKGLAENTFVKAGEATGIGIECLQRVEGVYVMCEKNLTLPNLCDEGMNEQEIAEQLRINRGYFADAMVEIVYGVQAKSRRLLLQQPNPGARELDT